MRSIGTWASALVVLAACTPFGGSNGGDVDGGASGDGGGTTSDGGPSAGGATGDAELLVTGLANPQFVHATSAGVYWRSGAAVSTGTAPLLHRCDLGGCEGAPAQLLDEHIMAMAADETGVYWATPTELRRCDLGATCTPTSIPSSDAQPLPPIVAIVPVGGELIVGTNENFDGALRRCSTSACAAAFWTGQRVGVVTASGSDIYFTTGAPAALVRWRGGSATPLGTLPELTSRLAAAGTHLFAVSHNRLFHCKAETKCTLSLFAPDETKVFDVRVEGDAVFYSVLAKPDVAGRIMRCPLEDCSAPTTVHQGGNPQVLSLRDGWVYFADDGGGSGGDGSIYRVRIPAP